MERLDCKLADIVDEVRLNASNIQLVKLSCIKTNETAKCSPFSTVRFKCKHGYAFDRKLGNHFIQTKN